MKKYALLFITSFCFAISFAQKPLQISAEGKKYTIPCFKEDSVLELEKWYTKQNIIEPIKQSKGDWEIRMLTPEYEKGTIYTIGSQRDSIYMNEINFYGGDLRHQPYGKEELVDSGNSGWGVFRTVTQLMPIVSVDSFLEKMITNNLGCLMGTKEIVDSLKRKGITPAVIIDRTHYAKFYFEFKVNNSFRNFKYEAKFIAGNENILDFQNSINLIRTTRKFFDKQSTILKNEKE